jgi:hypothetical protein
MSHRNPRHRRTNPIPSRRRLPERTARLPLNHGETTVVVVTSAGQVDADPALEALVKLFGAELGAKVWKREGIKLDPTVDRGVFREQRDHLKELGYRFDAKAQAWALVGD